MPVAQLSLICAAYGVCAMVLSEPSLSLLGTTGFVQCSLSLSLSLSFFLSFSLPPLLSSLLLACVLCGVRDDHSNKRVERTHWSLPLCYYYMVLCVCYIFLFLFFIIFCLLFAVFFSVFQ